MPKLNQKGAIPFVAIAVIAIIVIGGFFLATKNSSNSQKNPPQSSVKKQSAATPKSSPSAQWKTYQDEKYGYSLKHPDGWTVENLPAENRRLIKVSDDTKTAFVLIEAFTGSRLENNEELDKVLGYLGEKLKKDSRLKVTSFSKIEIKNDVGGYNAKGEETYGENTVLFEEKMMVGKTGRSMRIHAAYTPDSKEINQPITAEIIKSFSTD